MWEKGKGGVGLWGAEQGSDLDVGHFKLGTGRPSGDIRWALKRPQRRALIVRAGIHLASAFPAFPEQAVPHGAPSDGGEDSVFSPPSLYPHTRMLNPELPVSAKWFKSSEGSLEQSHPGGTFQSTPGAGREISG